MYTRNFPRKHDLRVMSATNGTTGTYKDDHDDCWCAGMGG